MTLKYNLIGVHYFEFKDLVPIWNINDDTVNIVVKFRYYGNQAVNTNRTVDVYKNDKKMGWLQNVNVRMSAQKIEDVGRNLIVEIHGKMKNEIGELEDYTEMYVNRLIAKVPPKARAIEDDEFAVQIVELMLRDGTNDDEIVRIVMQIGLGVDEALIRKIIKVSRDTESWKDSSIGGVVKSNELFIEREWDDVAEMEDK